MKFKRVNDRVIAHLYAQPFGETVIGIDERFPAAHTKRIGARNVARPR